MAPRRVGLFAVNSTLYTLIKQKMKLSLYILGNSDGSGCKVICEEGLPNIYKMRRYLTIYCMRRPLVILYMTLQLLPSEFPFIRGNFNFLFDMGYTQQFIFKKFRIS
jgi:hypothetical protein